MTEHTDTTASPVSPEEGVAVLDRLTRIYDELVRPDGPFAMVDVAAGERTVRAFAGAPRSLGSLFHASEHPSDRHALIFGSERWTYGDLRARVAGLARYLRDTCRIVPGDHVAIACRNYPEWIVAFWASQIVGAVVIPLNGWAERRELAQLASLATPSVIVADGERLDRMAGWLSQHPDVHVLSVRCPAPRVAATDIAECMRHGRPGDLEPAPCLPTDPATVLFTSGTTGRPKGAVSTQLNHATALRYLQLRAAGAAAGGTPRPPAAASTATVQPASPPTTSLLTYPLFHISGIAVIVSALATGKRLVLMYRWDVDEALRLIDELGVNEVYSPPTVTRSVVDAVRAGGRELPTLRTVGGGGAASGEGLIRDVREAFNGRVAASTAYGLTETTGAVAALSGTPLAAFPMSVGRPMPGVRLRVVDAAGVDVTPGEPGELIVYGAVVADGYLGEPAETAKSFTDGWFRTGDLAVVDAYGLVHLVGRLKDIIIRGGENIHPAEIEEVLEQHPAVAEAAAFGVAHPVLGEEVRAVVRLRPQASVTAGDLRSHAARILARHKTPTEIRITSQPFPRTPAGKLRRNELVDPSASEAP